MSDTNLIDKLRRQDRSAQKWLYDRYAPLMFSVCRRYLRSREDAEEALVSGFYKVFSQINSFSGSGSLEGWIRRIMVNEALMLLRRQRLELVSDDLAQAIPAGTRTDSAIEAEDLYNMVRALPVGYRTVFNLFAIEGYSHQEIAAQLGITEGTSKSQLSKARAMLQEMLNSKGNHNAKEYRPAVSGGNREA